MAVQNLEAQILEPSDAVGQRLARHAQAFGRLRILNPVVQRKPFAVALLERAAKAGAGGLGNVNREDHA